MGTIVSEEVTGGAFGGAVEYCLDCALLEKCKYTLPYESQLIEDFGEKATNP